MQLTCPECKNDVNLSPYSDLDVDHVVECDMCGITLMVKGIDGENVSAEVIEEGK
ncbi:MAG: hypothetical protein UX39_C0019G0007 [Candidatus Magasanikbacteria bacterium GW2011_GWA2_46_17]|uniref:Lysine biosynthesis protein LysW n=1 Tax=Candidatus Magasanikbacteria bacterium GW2011_GWA2_46_17 TaxID=1619042 RepID=A0A0G1NZJ1_9BACT|nr:MAG: hypothetical protein UX39_C0019G0007 [Candidatus Magasanikbacteria bacterium GW2011_GWA2_46_17]